MLNTPGLKPSPLLKPYMSDNTESNANSILESTTNIKLLENQSEGKIED